ncbi:hypothetical protein JCM10914A_03840 [Paenibacillus sp. JCM 10914]|uniref:M67 family metallopeptidase n=1 Tax=Paenibacillus sp. JCM 10914 TaxID=1236974 RepID=UPI0003CC7214|nr:M67 family metallopeptidase [Paenibacillus sp. JCM 10914]GAE07938.1 hypothetical protein JCM10914_4187 [Paenibacillus sp. JCM 10914]
MSDQEAGSHTLIIRSDVMQHLAEHLYACFPYEACGVLIGVLDGQKQVYTVTRIIPIKNTAEDPLHSFALDPKLWTTTLFTERGIIGLFHSHPHSTPAPSGNDLAQLQSFGGLMRIYAIAAPAVFEQRTIHLETYKISSSHTATPVYTLTSIPLNIGHGHR